MAVVRGRVAIVVVVVAIVVVAIVGRNPQIKFCDRRKERDLGARYGES